VHQKEILEVVFLRHLLDHPIVVAILAVAAFRPIVSYLAEPARQVMDLLEQINGMGATIVMVTHDPELARRAHRNVQVIDGQITDYKPYEAHSASVTVLHPPAADATYG